MREGSRTSLPSSPLLFIAFFTSHRSPLSEHLEQASISVKRDLRKKTRSDHVTQNALAARNNEAYGQANGKQSFCTVLRYH